MTHTKTNDVFLEKMWESFLIYCSPLHLSPTHSHTHTHTHTHTHNSCTSCHFSNPLSFSSSASPQHVWSRPPPPLVQALCSFLLAAQVLLCSATSLLGIWKNFPFVPFTHWSLLCPPEFRGMTIGKYLTTHLLSQWMARMTRYLPSSPLSSLRLLIPYLSHCIITSWSFFLLGTQLWTHFDLLFRKCTKNWTQHFNMNNPQWFYFFFLTNALLKQQQKFIYLFGCTRS